MGSCFCDDACEDYGDCCDDKSDVCDEFGEVCGNGEDDNGDGFTDCDDPQCAATEECSGGSSWPEEPGDEFGEICFNGEDDNGDGLADCADPLCADDPDCHDGVVEDSCVGVCGGQAPAGCWCDDVCANEGDCCSDYADACEQPLGEWCFNGEDDNADDLIDCDDPQCADDPSCTDDAAPPSCDGFCGEQAPTGCWCDDACAEYGDCCPDQAELCSSEFSEFCGNGEDDNGDGLVDCEDPDCAAEC